MKDSLGDRMKGNYETRARHQLTCRVPVVVRVDGRAFHTFTRWFNRPYDDDLMVAMIIAAKKVASEMQGFKLGYVQSDEASFVLTDYDSINTQPWLGYVQNKIESLTASLMSVHFNRSLGSRTEKDYTAVFDARAFNVPESEVANYFLWRSKDWERNSVQMLAQTILSHKDLQGMNRSSQEHALKKSGNTWGLRTPLEKFGTFIVGSDRQCLHVPANYADVSKIWDSVRPVDDER